MFIDIKRKFVFFVGIFILTLFAGFFVLANQSLRLSNEKTWSEYIQSATFRMQRIGAYLAKTPELPKAPPNDEVYGFSGDSAESLLVIRDQSVVWGPEKLKVPLIQDQQVQEFIHHPWTTFGNLEVRLAGVSYSCLLQKAGESWIVLLRPLSTLNRNAAEQIQLWWPYFTLAAFVFFIFIVSIHFASYHLIRVLNDSIDLLGGKPLPAQKTPPFYNLTSPTILYKRIKDLVQELEVEKQQRKLMQVDLESTRDIQLTLLPPQTYNFDRVDILSFYSAAELCGGDFYYYFRVGRKIVCCVGDVTGHGVASSLLTASVRGTLALIEKEYDGLARSLDRLNYVVCSTARGQQQLTFLMVELDLENNKLSYISASHEAPALFIKKNGNYECEVLVDTHTKRLGESIEFEAPRPTFIDLPDEAILFMFTDGLTDLLANSAKRFFKSINGLLNNSVGKAGVKANLIEQLQRKMADAPPPDDVTFTLLEIRSALSPEVL